MKYLRTNEIFILHFIFLTKAFVPQYGGINVDVQISEGGVYISMSAYSPGNAPALIINHTPHTINLWEKGSINVRYVGNAPKRLLNLMPGCGKLFNIYLFDMN